MLKIFVTVKMSDVLPVEAGWYNIIGDCQPEACGRFWFDGKNFHVPTNYDNKTLYWLKYIY